MESLRGWLGRPATTIQEDFDEVKSLQDAFDKVALIMSEKCDEADAELSQSNSPYHKSFRGTIYVLRSVMGMEDETAVQGLPILTDAEQCATQYYNNAVKDADFAYRSSIYPAGAQFLLLQSGSALMYALVAIMSGSVTESLRALYKIKKAYAVVESIAKAEEAYLNSAAEIKAKHQSTTSVDTGDTASSQFDFDTISSHPVDHFIHGSMSLTFGLLQMVLSMIPQPFSFILSLLSLHADRQAGSDLIWEATKYQETALGAITCLILLALKNNVLCIATIASEDLLQKDRIDALVPGLRQRWPDSELVKLHESIILSRKRKLAESVEILKPGAENKTLPSHIRSLLLLEQAIQYICMHEYEKSANAWLEMGKCVDWSLAFFTYGAACAYVDAYRADKSNGYHAKKAEELLKKVMPLIGRKKVLGRELPIEGYVKLKMMKAIARAEATGCQLIDGIGVSPGEELIYNSYGHFRMNEEQLNLSLERLELSQHQELEEESAELKLIKSKIYRNQGRAEDAKNELQQVIPLSVKTWSKNADTWIIPVAHFDLADLIWEQAGGEHGDKTELRECGRHVAAAANFQKHAMEAALGLKVYLATSVLKSLGCYN